MIKIIEARDIAEGDAHYTAYGTTVDKSHSGRAFYEAIDLIEATAAMEHISDPRRRKTLERIASEASAKLEALTARDRDLTKAIAEYQRRFGTLVNATDFIRWWRGSLNSPWMIGDAAIRIRLRKDFGFRGERGRKRKRR